MTTERWRVGADVGGTFTDIVALSDRGRLERAKVSSTVRDYSRGIVDGVVARLGSDSLANVEEFVHGTTVATNAILEEVESRLALVTTAGFRDVLELRRARRPDLYDLTWTPPPPLVDRDLRMELDERIDAGGQVLSPLRDEDLARCAERIREAGVEAIAVCLLNSFVNPEHEVRAARYLQAALPEVMVTHSALIAPEIREFERTSTTVVNGFLLPVVASYLASLEEALAAAGVRAAVQVMQSDGTTATSPVVRRRPGLIIESGPAAGVSAAARLARELQRSAIVAFDMGGTTAKASLIEDYRVELHEELEVGDSLSRGGGLTRGSGYVVRAPCVDLTEVGSGGGSIAWIDSGGALRVGPRSAGSDPGPACYGGAGEQPTVTDAHVVLGYLNPISIAGGDRPIHADRAFEAIRLVSEPLGLSERDAAFGIYAIATATMRRAVRAVTVERGRDPNALSLVAFGGAGGLHAAALATEMEIPEVILPILAGLFSSLGLLLSDPAVTRQATLAAGTEAEVTERLLLLEADAREELLAQHPAAAGKTTVEHEVALRYAGQSASLMVSAQMDGDAPDIAGLSADFRAAHARAYGHADQDQRTEAVGVRVRVSWQPPKPSFAEIATAHAGADAGRGTGSNPSVRVLYFGPTVGARDAFVVSRHALGETPTSGPLVIEEAEGTIVVPPSFMARLDPTGSVLLTRSGLTEQT